MSRENSYFRLILVSILVTDPHANISDGLIMDVATRMGRRGVRGLNMRQFTDLAAECYQETIKT